MKLSDLLMSDEILDFSSDIQKIPVQAISSSTETVVLGSVFVCIDGMHTDAHRLIPESIARGASAVVLSNPSAAEQCTVPWVIVPDTRKALSYMLYRFYGSPADQMRVIAVTGTNGKTSLTYMLRAIFMRAGYKVGIIGTVRNMIGDEVVLDAGLTTPDPADLYRLLAQMRAQNCEYVFMEASSHALALNKLCAIPVDTGIFTNLTPDHLDFHHDMEHYKEAKQKLFAISRMSLVNMDSPYGTAMAEAAAGRIYRYGIDSGDTGTEFAAKSVNLLAREGIQYTLSAWNESMNIRSQIPGRFSVYNTMAAAAAAYLHGIRIPVIEAALKDMHGVEGRMERIPLEKVSAQPIYSQISLFLDFAHTPDALANVLRTARDFRRDGDRLVVVFGCGGDRDREKRPLMGAVASELADFTIITSDNCRSEKPEDIIADILTGFDATCPHVIIPDRESAILYALAHAEKGDIILLCGKGHENYIIDQKGKRHFSEREIAMRFAAENDKFKF